MSSLNAGSTNTTLESDWNVGSAITIHQWGLTIKDREQVVLESQPCQRLSYTWHTFTPEWREIARERVGFTEEFLNRIAAERRSKATFPPERQRRPLAFVGAWQSHRNLRIRVQTSE